MNWFRTATFGLAAAMVLTTTGCTLLHELKPHRMWRLNRVPNGMHKEAYFSVSDPIPERTPASQSAEHGQADATRVADNRKRSG